MDGMSKRGMLAVGLALIVAGCAGSGGMSSLPPASPEPPRSEEERRRAYAAHPEFRNQYGLERVKAHYAYARGATGEGVTLGIVDSGIDPDHPKFAGKLATENPESYAPDFGACDDRAQDGSCVSLLGHGTHVGGIMAAGRRADPDGGAGSESAVHGVAFDARVISVGFPSPEQIVEEIVSEYPDPTPEQQREIAERVRNIESVLEMRFASAFEGLNGRVMGVNASMGLPGNIEDFDAEALRARFPNAIRAIAQAGTPAGERTVYVWAAGNSNGTVDLDGSVVSATSVDIVAGLPVRIPELRGHSLAVVATDREGRIAGFSSRCGIAKDFCLAAPGVGITGPVPGFYCPAGTAACYLTLEEAGTSSAAPFVTGGIGLLAQHYRGQLGNDEIVARILATADRTGAYADSDVYGQGFLDLDAATRPVGGMRMLSGGSLSGPSAPSDASVFHLSGAFGDSLSRGLAQVEVASFDALDAPFFRPLGDHLRSRVFGGIGLEDRLGSLGRDPRGASWRMPGAELRLRLDAVQTLHRGGGAHGSGLRGEADVPAALGSLALSQELGNGRLLFGYRAHPGWRFGLHVGDDAGNRGFGSVEPGLFTDDGAFANPYLGFARDGASIGYAAALDEAVFRVAAFQGRAQYGERRDAGSGEARGVLAEYLFADTGLAVQAGWLGEAQAAMGGRPGGAFGGIAADTVMAGLSAHRALSGGWHLLASAHAGKSRTELRRRGMVSDLSALWTSSCSVGLVGEDVGRAGSRLAFRISQPLRVEAGRAGLRWVSGRTPDGGGTVEEAALDLVPSGRQIDFEVTWSRPWAGGEAHLAAIATREPGHVHGKDRATLLARYRRVF